MPEFSAAVGILFISQENKNKDERKNALELIKERQIQAEEGKKNPLVIYPEGGTTNGEYIIKFKKGAFASLRAV